MNLTNVPPRREGCSLVLDASKVQAGFSWLAAKDAGAVAALCKATEGETLVDSLWEADSAAAASAGLMVGSYHVFRPEHPNPEVQARKYCDVARPRTMLCPVIDLELDGRGSVPGELVAERALRFVAESYKLWGKKTGLVYGPSSFLQQLAHANGDAMAVMAGYWKLWVAHYGVAHPVVPSPWQAWTGWQFSGGTNHVNGVPVDLSWFVGGELDVATLGATR